MICCGGKSTATRSPPVVSSSHIPRCEAPLAPAPTPAPAGTKPVGVHPDRWRTHVLHFYKHYKKYTSATEVDRIMRDYAGREGVFLERMTNAFGSGPVRQLVEGYYNKSLPVYCCVPQNPSPGPSAPANPLEPRAHSSVPSSDHARQAQRPRSPPLAGGPPSASAPPAQQPRSECRVTTRKTPSNGTLSQKAYVANIADLRAILNSVQPHSADVDQARFVEGLRKSGARLQDLYVAYLGGRPQVDGFRDKSDVGQGLANVHRARYTQTVRRAAFTAAANCGFFTSKLYMSTTVIRITPEGRAAAERLMATAVRPVLEAHTSILNKPPSAFGFAVEVPAPDDTPTSGASAPAAPTPAPIPASVAVVTARAGAAPSNAPTLFDPSYGDNNSAFVTGKRYQAFVKKLWEIPTFTRNEDSAIAPSLLVKTRPEVHRYQCELRLLVRTTIRWTHRFLQRSDSVTLMISRIPQGFTRTDRAPTLTGLIGVNEIALYQNKKRSAIYLLVPPDWRTLVPPSAVATLEGLLEDYHKLAGTSGPPVPALPDEEAASNKCSRLASQAAAETIHPTEMMVPSTDHARQGQQRPQSPPLAEEPPSASAPLAQPPHCEDDFAWKPRALSATPSVWSATSVSTGIQFSEEEVTMDDTEPRQVDSVTPLESETDAAPKVLKPKFDPTAPRARGREIGRGGFGRVFKVFDPCTLTVIAVKEIHHANLHNGGCKFMREIDIMTDLSHPNIIEYLGAHRSDNVCKIYTEYAAAGSLASVLEDSGPLPGESSVTTLMHQILLGVEYLHSRDVVHHDLKCENILLQQEPAHQVTAKVADFGAAKELALSTASYTGTCGFMAPEMVKFERDKTNPPTEKADIWSLGCVVVQLLTARPPCVQPDDRLDMAEQVMQQVPATVSDSCRQFIKDCVQMHPEARPSCTELLRSPWLS